MINFNHKQTFLISHNHHVYIYMYMWEIVSHHYVNNKLHIRIYSLCLLVVKPFHSTNHCCLSLNMNRIYI
jgi:hypothetical protein